MSVRSLSGSRDAKFLFVGEAPGKEEEKAGVPFVGSSGQELTRELEEAGWQRDQFRFANVINTRPADNKISEFMPETVKEAKAKGATQFRGRWVMPPVIEGFNSLVETIKEMPNLEMIIGAGNTPLWALLNQSGITNWRGSQTYTEISGRKIPFMPVIHPAAILRNWADRMPTLEDFRRARSWATQGFVEPSYRFIVRPSFRDSCDWINSRLSYLDRDPSFELLCAVDIETRLGHIACVGLADSPLDAICIPFMEVGGSYFPVDEEIHVQTLLRKLLTHPRFRLVGQNWLYDRQYFAKHLGYNLRPFADTMVMQHVCFPGTPKGLAYICSLYNHFYCFWKEESKDWAPHLGEEQLWIYNCKDAAGTFEAKGHIDKFVDAFSLKNQLASTMEDCEWAFEMMLRGVPVDFAFKSTLADKGSDVEGKDNKPVDKGLIAIQMREHQEFIRKIIGVPRFSIASPKQVHWLCYEILKLPPIRKKGAKNLTADKDAVAEWLRSCEPLYRPILQSIVDYRSLQVFRGTFALASVDPDGRFRCSINVAGPSTFRLSTSEDAFGFGTNMQNLPKGDED